MGNASVPSGLPGLLALLSVDSVAVGTEIRHSAISVSIATALNLVILCDRFDT